MTLLITLLKAIGILAAHFCLVAVASRFCGMSNDRKRDIEVLIDRRVE
jgi:hypothetical protein